MQFKDCIQLTIINSNNEETKPFRNNKQCLDLNPLSLCITGTHYVMYDTIPDSVRMMKEISQKIFEQPVLTFAKVNSENSFVKLTKTVTFCTHVAYLAQIGCLVL